MKKYKIFLSLLVVFTIFFGTFYQSSAATQEELQKLIEALQSQIKYLQQQLSQLVAQQLKSCPFVTVGLSKGYFDEPTSEVKELQKLLKQDKSIYPEGLVTGYFGRLTETALKRFQAKYNLSQSGIVDEATRQKLCEVYLSRFPSPTTTETITTTTSYPTPYLPDLTITEFYYSPSFPQPGQSVYFTLKVANSGLGNAPFSKLEVFLGSQIIYNTEIILKAGETKQFNFSWNCPSWTAGDYGFQASIDKDNLINEVREDNNEKIIEMCCGCVPTSAKPDLVIDKITFKPSLPLTPGTKISDFVVYVRNIGDTTVDQGYYISVTIDGTPVSSWLETRQVPPGQTIASQFPAAPFWTCPSTGGSYAMQVYVDYYYGQQAIDESNESNNVFPIAINCGTPVNQKPDLIVKSIVLSDYPEVDKPINFKIEIQNDGELQADSPNYVNLKVISAPSEVNTGGIGTLIYPSLPAGARETERFDWQCIAPGYYTLEAEVDPYNYIVELNENNNKKTISFSCLRK